MGEKKIAPSSHERLIETKLFILLGEGIILLLKGICDNHVPKC